MSTDLDDGTGVYSKRKTATANVRVGYRASTDTVTIRIDRADGTGRPLYETMTLSLAEAEAVRAALADEID